jgi:hypothetical protein
LKKIRISPVSGDGRYNGCYRKRRKEPVAAQNIDTWGRFPENLTM